MKKKYIQLPKPYLSYSQIALWMSNPATYKGIYFDQRDELRTTNAGQAYGKVVADALEHGIQTGDLLTDAAMLMLPKYDVMDKEFDVDMKTKDGWVKVLAKPDTLDSTTKSIVEYKTGKTAWTQSKAQMHLQLKYYAMAVYLKYKVVPKVKLCWIETEMHHIQGIRPTGHVEEFEVVYTLKDMLDTMALTSKVAKEIEIAFASHVTNPEYATL